MVELEYIAGSPFARAVRVLLHELRMDYVGREAEFAPTPRQLGADTPTMQVPTLRDGDLVLWESGVIADYLMRTSSSRFCEEPRLATELWRPNHEWADKLLFGTVQTFGTSVTTISQLTWTGVTIRDNPHLRRCAERANRILT
ncbi:glutathione S-transferase N-terminal domain-containing protein [Rhodobacter sp. NTK016B]|uniref:glutathione S-transferase N-terminal domain-containing protein n=1 Tax=Rhodobacter sp. NTK016B TaxID=2759676 RepID=UPI001A8F9891|nr:glutathione S-transferase N-terminal domain-containing protein [Rhodobacter sp. NTK016B]